MTEKKISLCKMYIEKYAAPAVSGEGGHNQAFRTCNAIFNGFDLSRDEGWPIFMDYCSRCVPPFRETEAKHLYSELMKKPPRKPRGWLLKLNSEEEADK